MFSAICAEEPVELKIGATKRKYERLIKIRNRRTN